MLGKPGKRLASVHHEAAGAMQRSLTLHGVNEGHVINAGGQFWEEAAHPKAALAMLAEREVATPTVAWLRGEELHLPVRIKGFTTAFGEHWLVVKGVHMTHATGAENLDHTLCAGAMVQRRCRPSGGVAFAEKRRQSHACKSAACAG
jgi:hypothetical protein